MSTYLIARIESASNISLHLDSEIDALDGDKCLESVTWVNRTSRAKESAVIGAMFVMIGADPNTQWLGTNVALDKKGFIETGSAAAFECTPYATSVPGVYAVGDVRSGSAKRVASAVGEGSVVIADVHRYLSCQRDLAVQTDSVLAAIRAGSAPF